LQKATKQQRQRLKNQQRVFIYIFLKKISRSKSLDFQQFPTSFSFKNSILQKTSS